MFKLEKEDPVYYKTEINKLIKQARENGVLIDYSITERLGNVRALRVNFEAENGDIASATVYDCEWNKDGD